MHEREVVVGDESVLIVGDRLPKMVGVVIVDSVENKDIEVLAQGDEDGDHAGDNDK